MRSAGTPVERRTIGIWASLLYDYFVLSVELEPSPNAVA
jgi:hypothetical protein